MVRQREPLRNQTDFSYTTQQERTSVRIDEIAINSVGGVRLPVAGAISGILGILYCYAGKEEGGRSKKKKKKGQPQRMVTISE